MVITLSRIQMESTDETNPDDNSSTLELSKKCFSTIKDSKLQRRTRQHGTKEAKNMSPSWPPEMFSMAEKVIDSEIRLWNLFDFSEVQQLDLKRQHASCTVRKPSSRYFFLMQITSSFESWFLMVPCSDMSHAISNQELCTSVTTHEQPAALEKSACKTPWGRKFTGVI